MSAIAAGAVAATGAGAAAVLGGGGVAPATGPPMTEIPAALRMPHEGELGWQRDDNPDAGAAFPGCGTSDPTRVGRTDARTMTITLEGRRGRWERYVQQVLLFDTAGAAESALTGYGAAVRACEGWTVRQEDPDRHDPPFLGWKRTGDYPRLDHEDLEGRRVGNAVILLYLHQRGTDGFPTHLLVNDRNALGMQLCLAMRLCPPGTPPPSTPRPSYTPTPVPVTPWPTYTPTPVPGTPWPTYTPTPVPGTPYPTGTASPTVTVAPWPTPTRSD